MNPAVPVRKIMTSITVCIDAASLVAWMDDYTAVAARAGIASLAPRRAAAIDAATMTLASRQMQAPRRPVKIGA